MDTSIYNHLLSTFDTKYTTKYANKPSELRSLVKKIRNQTQSSPVYLVDFTNAKQSYVLGVKEASMKLHESMQVLADTSQDSVFSRKKARSSDNAQVGAELVDSDAQQLPSAFTIQVNQLANSQVNRGKEYYETGKSLPAGSYQFRISVNDASYDFQYNIRKDANHREVIRGLSDFITKAKIGIQAEPYSTDREKIGMRLESTSVGTPDGGPSFDLQDKTDGRSRGIVEYYGLNQVAVMPKNASFILNGVEKTSMSNEFTLAREVKVSLRMPSEQVATVDYHPDGDSILAGVRDFISNYNDLIERSVTFERQTDTHSKLIRELNGLSAPYRNELESCGLTFDGTGFMQMDTSLAMQAIEEGDMQKLFSVDSPVVSRLFAKSDAIKINPMEYVDKKIVSYPNTAKPPRGYSYISSLYSGLLFNSYC